MLMRVYNRITTRPMTRVRQTVWRAIIPSCWLGGLTKLGSTPAGGSIIPAYSVDIASYASINYEARGGSIRCCWKQLLFNGIEDILTAEGNAP